MWVFFFFFLMAQQFLFSLMRKICPTFLGGRPGICRPCSGVRVFTTEQGGRLGPGSRGGAGCEGRGVSVASRNRVTAGSGHQSRVGRAHAALSPGGRHCSPTCAGTPGAKGGWPLSADVGLFYSFTVMYVSRFKFIYFPHTYSSYIWEAVSSSVLEISPIISYNFFKYYPPHLAYLLQEIRYRWTLLLYPQLFKMLFHIFISFYLFVPCGISLSSPSAHRFSIRLCLALFHWTCLKFLSIISMVER